MLRMRPSLSTAKSVPLIGLSALSGPSPQEKRSVVAKTVGFADQPEFEIRKALLHACDQRDRRRQWPSPLIRGST